jgi:alanine racemase
LEQDLTWIEISRNHLSYNLNALADQVGGMDRICAVVKGNAYGHGIELMVPLLTENGVRTFAVYHTEEAIRTRKLAGPDALVILLGFAPTHLIPELVFHQIECLLLNRERLQEIHEGVPEGRHLNMHLKIDTGMNRFGLQPSEIKDFLLEIENYPRLSITGAASHFANSWNISDPSYASFQSRGFKDALASLGELNGRIKHRHISNTAALMVHTDQVYSFVRVGIGLYGYYPNEEVKMVFYDKLNLRPILSFKSRIVSVKNMNVGEYAGYDITFQAKRQTKIALAPLGYSDGFPFAHSDKGAYVLIHGRRVPLIGRVNMNALLLDVTDLERVGLGDVITLIGSDGDESITVWDWMSWGTPHLYESLTKMRFGLPRYVV